MKYFDDKRASRSDKYQYLILEIQFDNEILASFSNNNSISGYLNPFKYDEEVLDLQDKLKERFWLLAEKSLTPLQFNVMKMLNDGYTQQEIANSLNVNQSSICKCIKGNTSYSPGKEAKMYGGYQKKLKRVVTEDKEIMDLLNQINELREERL